MGPRPGHLKKRLVTLWTIAAANAPASGRGWSKRRSRSRVGHPARSLGALGDQDLAFANVDAEAGRCLA